MQRVQEMSLNFSPRPEGLGLAYQLFFATLSNIQEPREEPAQGLQSPPPTHTIHYHHLKI